MLNSFSFLQFTLSFDSLLWGISITRKNILFFLLCLNFNFVYKLTFILASVISMMFLTNYCNFNSLLLVRSCYWPCYLDSIFSIKVWNYLDTLTALKVRLTQVTSINMLHLLYSSCRLLRYFIIGLKEYILRREAEDLALFDYGYDTFSYFSFIHNFLIIPPNYSLDNWFRLVI